MKKSLLFAALIVVSFSLLSAQSNVQRAVCKLNPTQGSKVTGTVTFTKVADGVHIVAEVGGLSKGKHGIHVHEFGDCSSSDGSSAGGHFNPHSKSHGGPHDAERHSGDMGNIDVDENGKGRLDYIDKTIALNGHGSIIGKSIIVHANEDDLKSQPTGNAGGRLACGIIEAQ